MNFREELTCKHCNEIYTNPIALNCCGETICKPHIDEIFSNKSANKRKCPLCDQEIKNQSFSVNKLVQKMLTTELHKFEVDSNYKKMLDNLKTEIQKLETILNDPETIIYDEMSELKRKVDLDREQLKIEIDNQANDLIQQLDSYERKFKTEYKSHIRFEHFNYFVESSKKQLAENERYLSIFAFKKEDIDQRNRQTEQLVNLLRTKTKELNDKLFADLSIEYKPFERVFSRLIVKNKKSITGIIKNEFATGYRNTLAVMPNGDLVCVGSTIEIRDPNNGTVKRTLTDTEDSIYDLVVYDDNCLISATEDSTIKIWNINKGKVERTLKEHIDAVKALVLLNKNELASGSDDATIQIWDIRDGTVKKSLFGCTNNITSLVLLKNGDLASASDDDEILIWDVDSETVKKRLVGHTDGVLKLTVLENGDLVSGCKDGEIKIWDVETGTVKRTLTGHTDYVFALKVLNNGDLVSGSEDRTIKIWNVDDGTVKRDLEVNSTINSLEVLPNGDLVSASDHSVIIWE